MITSRRARNTTFAALAAMASLSLVACGSDPAGTAAPGSSSGSEASNASGLTRPAGKLNAEGSSAQANAITEAIADYGSACTTGATIEYNPTGSGAGIKSFYNGLVDFAGDFQTQDIGRAGRGRIGAEPL